MRLILVIAVGLFFSPLNLLAQPADFYTPYAKVLSTYVDDQALVDYTVLKTNRTDLDTFVKQLGTYPVDDFSRLKEKAQIVFLVNAYNAFTLKVIIDNYPIKSSFFRSVTYPKKSIQQISGVFSDVEFVLMGKPTTLDDIEHETLRKKYNAPYVHLALVCAARSCPPLLGEPYRAEKLDDQIKTQGQKFFNKLGAATWNAKSRVFSVSRIFKWFGEDFEQYSENALFNTQGLNPQESGIALFVYGYLPSDVQNQLAEKPFSLNFLDYDWTLNDQTLGRS